MKMKLIPENDYDRMDLGLITPGELGKKMAQKSLKNLEQKMRKEK